MYKIIDATVKDYILSAKENTYITVYEKLNNKWVEIWHNDDERDMVEMSDEIANNYIIEIKIKGDEVMSRVDIGIIR